MCRISKVVKPQSYERETRSVRLNGYVTSMGLEEEFWTVLRALAGGQGMSTGQLLATLYDEYVRSGRASNFTSFLRVSCVEFVRKNSLAPEGAFARAAANESSSETFPA